MALWRIRATVDDRPGYLSVLTASLALRAVNILAVQVHTTEGGAVDDFLVDAPDAMSERDLMAAVQRGRGRDPWVAPAEAQALADQPTRALALAARLVRDPDGLGGALRSLLGAAKVTWRAAPSEACPGFDATTMRLPDPAGGGYEVIREAPAFTPAEFARAQALVDVAGATVRQADEPVTLMLPHGAEMTVRRGAPEDVAALIEMEARCTSDPRGRRRSTVASSPTRWRRVLDRGRTISLVATAGQGLLGGDLDRVVGIATLVPEGAIAEVSLLVEDGWQRQGLGTALLRRLVAHAQRAGLAALVFHLPGGNHAMLRTLRRLGPVPEPDLDGPIATVTLALSGSVHPGAVRPVAAGKPSA